MNIICSPAGIVDPFRPGQGIMDIVNAGFKNISLELDMCCSSYELEHFGEPPEDEYGSVARQFLPVSVHPAEITPFFKKMFTACEQNHLQIPIARAPYLPRDTKRTDLREEMYRIHEECIRVCGEIGCRYLVTRPWNPDGTCRDAWAPCGKDDPAPESEKQAAEAWASGGIGRDIWNTGGTCRDAWDINRKYYLRLATAARKANVMILLENQCRNLNGHLVRGICSDSETAAHWVDELNSAAGRECFGFCMDVGVCSLGGQDMREFAIALGDRIKAVVLRDCDGQHESAMLPFTCTYAGQPQTDWLSLIRGLRETGFDGQLILHIPDTMISFSPLLRPQLMALAKATAEYFKWQIEIENLLKKYDSIVLFGAGNMCRNYLKCYGKKYPPLFTCDNNKKVWGTNFCGLEVKSPEVLKNLPEGCGIFICNIYYREIERQLRDMGIQNIEFFNDEYMPSFYFDRLKGV